MPQLFSFSRALIAALALALTLAACGDRDGEGHQAGEGAEGAGRTFAADRGEAPAGGSNPTGDAADREGETPAVSQEPRRDEVVAQTSATPPAPAPGIEGVPEPPLQTLVSGLLERVATEDPAPRLLDLRSDFVAGLKAAGLGDPKSRKASAHRILFRALEARKAAGGAPATSPQAAQARARLAPTIVADLKAELADTTQDPLASLAEGILTDVILGKAGKQDYEALRKRLIDELENQQLGDGPARFQAADSIVGSIFREFERAGGRTSGSLSRLQRQAILAKSENLASDLYRRLPFRGTGKRHEGRLLKRAVDFEVPKGHEKVSWGLLGGFTYEEGGAIPDEVMALSGKSIGIAGYMITLEQTEGIREFLLVESLWSCCFGTPPEVHQVVVATVPWEAGVEYTPEALVLLGKIDVGEEIEDGFVTSLYRLALTKVSRSQ